MPGTLPMLLYSSACGEPSTALPLRARSALATATRPAHCGVDRLVPPTLIQLTAVLPGVMTATYWPLAGSALKATSPTLRRATVPRPGTGVFW